MEKQIRYYEDYVKKMQGEVALLKRLGEEEGAEIKSMARAQVATSGKGTVKAESELLKKIQSETDRKARRNFCMYADQAKTNGHSFQAALIEKQLLPKLNEQLEGCKRARVKRIASLNEKPPVGTNWDKQDQPWKWKEQAALAGMSDQYDFIYSFTSRLLHATPVSLTTNQKLLEPEEMHMFLEYIYVSILDIVDLAKNIVEVPAGNTVLH